MDFDNLLSHYKAKACVVSVEFFPDGTYGNIRVVAGNKAHCDDMAGLNHPFEPGCPYEACFPKNPPWAPLHNNKGNTQHFPGRNPTEGGTC